jgi:hypothetical protein
MKTYWHHLGCSKKMVLGSGSMATCDKAHGSILDKLQLIAVRWLGVWKPDCRSITENGLEALYVTRRVSLS